MEILEIATIALGSLVALVLISHGVEALRPRPARPEALPWGPGIPVEYADLDGIKVRYIRTGSGPTVVMLHTLRTQLDIFQKVIPELARHFTVLAWDYPGHGWSDIPLADYAPEEFYRWTAAFLDTLKVEQATMVGVSIGGTISQVLAARQNPRIARVIAINPYDDIPGGGIRRTSLMAGLILGPSGVPILGATLMRLRSRIVSDQIMLGGVASAAALSPELRRELYDVGSRPGHYQGFLNLLAHERGWARAPSEYGRIRVPTLLVYGAEDWAPEAARERNRTAIPGVVMATVNDGGHFLPLDRPGELTEMILHFVTSTQSPSDAQSRGS